jgi:hypothetical protein
MCEEHARNFMPAHNEHAAKGEFHWGEMADKKFDEMKGNFDSTTKAYAAAAFKG